MTAVLKSIVQKIRRLLSPSSKPASVEYSDRLQSEQAFYQDCLEVHQLPDIFHYWSNKYLAPDMHRFGFTNPDDFFTYYISEYLAAQNRSCAHILSVGSGNCDLELATARKLIDQGHDDFVFECLDINKDMLERGRKAAEQAGLSKYFLFTRGDFNKWSPAGTYGIVLANQALHHVMNLEDLFDAIRQSLAADGLFLVSDMIGRNGHMRWPEAMRGLKPFWDELPAEYRNNRLLNRYEEQYINHDCSTHGFEGIRAQDILPLLLKKFNFSFFFPFGNMIFVFIDRPFGHNFDAGADWDKDFIDRVHASDEAGFLSGELKPTSMLAVLTNSEPDTLLRRNELTPEYCVRNPPK